jgi:hypothetical protein
MGPGKIVGVWFWGVRAKLSGKLWEFENLVTIGSVGAPGPGIAHERKQGMIGAGRGG